MKKYKDILAMFVNILAHIAMNELPSITPIYATQFSHIKSINLANKSGFKMAMAFVNAD